MTVRERLSSDNDPRSGGWDDDTRWSERAAFRIAVESREVNEGRLVWRTRAYHEEHDQRRVWTGVPDKALLEWIHDQLRQSIGDAVPQLVRRLPASTAPATPTSAASPDDLQQIPGIGPAIARRLRAAGITTFAALAACSLVDLAAWTGRSTEQITRMGWIERARALAHPAPPAAPASKPTLAGEAPEPLETPPARATITEAEEALPVAAGATTSPTTREAPVAEPEEALAEPVTEKAALVEAVAAEPAAVMETSPSGEEAEHPPVMEAPPVETTIAEPLAAETPAVEAAKAEPLAVTEAPPSGAEEIQEAWKMMIEESPIVFAAILLDEEGDVRNVRLTTTGERPPEWNDQQVARFFIETGAPLPDQVAHVSVHLDDVHIDTVPAPRGKGVASRLHATARVRLEGEEAADPRRTTCHVFLLAYDLAAGETHVLSTTRTECAAGAPDVPVALDADLPDVGRYQLLMAALVPEARALSAVSGPRLRVTP